MLQALGIRELGLLDYERSWLAMQRFTDERKLDPDTPDEVWLVQHPPVFTQGQAGKAEHLLLPGDIPVIKSDRGGQVTYHGPGQLVAYLMLDVRRLGYGVRELVTRMEQCLIDLLASYGVSAAAKADAPGVLLETLVPDYRGRMDVALEITAAEPPDVFNHNLETVPRLYKAARPGSDYQWSLTLLQRFKQMMPHIPTKSGLMLGLGETDEEVIEVMKRMREHDIDMLTLGQYLQPSRNHLPVQRFVHPDVFAWFAEEGYKMGFKNVASGPLVRSSYHADEQAKLVKSMLVSA